MNFEEKIEQLKKIIEVIKDIPEGLQEKAFDYLIGNSQNITLPFAVAPATAPFIQDSTPQPVMEGVQVNNAAKYARLFTCVDDGKVYLHKKIPGDKNTVKMKNIALIVLYAKGTPIFGDEIKNLCEKNNCLDKPNFSTTFDKDNNFIKKGKKGSSKWTIELTMDGQEAAEELLEEMLNASK